MLENLDLSKYKNIFCDSKEALTWAYKNGLSKECIIFSSSPAVLWDRNFNAFSVERKWSEKKFKKFQSTIQKKSENIYSAIIDNVTREEALAISLAFVEFHKIIYKAACLSESDLIEPRLFLRVDGSGGPNGNHMNSPWDLLLKVNPNFNSIDYTLQKKSWSVSSIAGVPLSLRISIAGVETILYRIALKVFNKLPKIIRKKQLLVHNENELLIEVVSNFVLRGMSVKKIEPNIQRHEDDFEHPRKADVCKSIDTIVHDRLEKWLIPGLVGVCKELFMARVGEVLCSMHHLKIGWKNILDKENRSKNVLITGSPGNINGFSLTGVCREMGIPVVSVQHGVTVEICSNIGEVSSAYDINTSDYYLSYNEASENIERKSFFSRGKSFTVGMSMRHLRMNKITNHSNLDYPPIVYISTNLYKGNLGHFVGWATDYERSLTEKYLISNVLSQVPYKIRYKTYPEDNRRYPDKDPIEKFITKYENIELFEKKIDMRFLLQQHRVIVTSSATSTIAWPIMANKPTVFINWSKHDSLSKEAYESFSNGLFLFDENSENFHQDLKVFLSKPISEIIELWDKKEIARNDMIKVFFSKYLHGAGRRSRKIIESECFL